MQNDLRREITITSLDCQIEKIITSFVKTPRSVSGFRKPWF